jgi:hypothetical protein
MPDETSLMTIAEFAADFRLGKDAAYRFAGMPGFPAIRYGKKILVIRHLLPKWLEENQGRTFEAEPMPASVRTVFARGNA